MLKDTEIEFLKKDFPSIKLPYENIIHNKVSDFDIAVIIPYGIKCFIHFCYLDDEPKCLIYEIDKKKINKIWIAKCCFSSILCFGTILYGTLYCNNKIKKIYIENIFQFKGNFISDNLSYDKKLEQINLIFHQYLKTISLNDNFVIFEIPILSKYTSELENITKQLFKFKIFKVVYYGNNTYASIKYCDYSKEDATLISIFSINQTLSPNKNSNIKYNNKLNTIQNKLKLITTTEICPTFRFKTNQKENINININIKNIKIIIKFSFVIPKEYSVKYIL